MEKAVKFFIGEKKSFRQSSHQTNKMETKTSDNNNDEKQTHTYDRAFAIWNYNSHWSLNQCLSVWIVVVALLLAHARTLSLAHHTFRCLPIRSRTVNFTAAPSECLLLTQPRFFASLLLLRHNYKCICCFIKFYSFSCLFALFLIFINIIFSSACLCRSQFIGIPEEGKKCVPRRLANAVVVVFCTIKYRAV